MITLTVIAILGILLLLVLRQLFQKQQQPVRASAPARPVEDLASIKIADARPGDTVSITGAGDQYSDLDFTVDRRSDYSVGQRRWVELSGMYKERRVLLEISITDETEVNAVTDGQKYTLADLQLSEDDLGEMDERQNTADNFQFDGKPWYYVFSKEFVSAAGGPGSKFYGWLFREEGGRNAMLIRKMEGEPFTAVIGARVNPGDITVYRA